MPQSKSGKLTGDSMSPGKNDKLLTTAIIIVAVAGVLYFGLSALRDDNKRIQENPFEYDISSFEESGRESIAYQEVLTIGLDLVAPYALAVDASDRLYVSGDRTLLMFDEHGDKRQTVPTDRPVSALAVDVNGDIYCAAGEYIEVLDSTGAKTAQWQDLGVDAILTSVAVGENDVYLADAGQLVVWHFNKAGDLLGEIGKKDAARDIPGFVIPSPYFDVLVDADGFLWAVNTGMHQFENFAADGSLRSFWGKAAMTVDGFSGCCNPSHATMMEDGSFVTAEKGIPRVKIHNRAGGFVCLVAASNQFDEGTVGLDLAVDSKGRVFVLDPKRKQVRIFKKLPEKK